LSAKTFISIRICIALTSEQLFIRTDDLFKAILTNIYFPLQYKGNQYE